MIGLPRQDPAMMAETRLWIEKHSAEARRRHEERTGENVRVVIHYPANLAEFRNEVQQLADGCARIEAFGIMSHGNIGYLRIGSNGVTERNMEEAFGHGLSCVMSANATVEIAGCNVGRGCRGAEFMLAAASRLLPLGGRLSAPEYYVYGNALLGLVPQSLLGDRELRVGAGGAHPQWTRGADPGAGCAVR